MIIREHKGLITMQEAQNQMQAEDIGVSLAGDVVVEIGKLPPVFERKQGHKYYRQTAYSIVSHS